MIEEIMSTVSKYMGEKVKVSKGVLVVCGIGAFIIGLITGVCAAKLTMSKKIATAFSSGDDFDADEYVRNLNFDEEN